MIRLEFRMAAADPPADSPSDDVIPTKTKVEPTTEDVPKLDEDESTLPTEPEATGAAPAPDAIRSSDLASVEVEKENDKSTTKEHSAEATPKAQKKTNGSNITLPMKAVQTAAERSTDFNELRSYEAKRRSIYATKLKSTSIYWRSYRKLLTDVYQETDRAENLIRGTLVANEAYHKFLRAAAEDRLDQHGKPSAGRRVSKMQMDKHKIRVSLQSGLNLKTAMDMAGVDVKKKSSENLAADGEEEESKVDLNVSFDGLASDTMIHNLVSSHAAMADVFEQNIDFTKDVTLVKMEELRKELESEVSVMSALGDATLYELNRAEADVQKAWGK